MPSDQDQGDIGVGAVAIIGVEMVDETNGYYLCRYGPWTVWQPGFLADFTYSPAKTLTAAEFFALSPPVKIPDTVATGTYDLARKQWTSTSRT